MKRNRSDPVCRGSSSTLQRYTSFFPAPGSSPALAVAAKSRVWSALAVRDSLLGVTSVMTGGRAAGFTVTFAIGRLVGHAVG